MKHNEAIMESPPVKADIPADAVSLEETYKKKIGKVTFLVHPIGKSNGCYTAQQLLLQMLEGKMRNGSITK